MASVTIAQVEKDLTDHLASSLPAGIDADRVKWQNAPFTTPNNEPWLRATMITPDVIDEDASGCYREYQGQFIVDVFHPKDTGTRAALTMANEVAESFTRTAFDYSFSIAAEVENIGEEVNTPWYHVRAVATYQFGSYSGE